MSTISMNSEPTVARRRLTASMWYVAVLLFVIIVVTGASYSLGRSSAPTQVIPTPTQVTPTPTAPPSTDPLSIELCRNYGCLA